MIPLIYADIAVSCVDMGMDMFRLVSAYDTAIVLLCGHSNHIFFKITR